MAEGPEESPADPEPPVKNYRPFAPGPLPPDDRRAVTIRLVVGFLVYVGLTAVWFLFTWRPYRARWVFTIWGYITVAILAITLWLRIAHGYKGYGYGVLTALLCAFLVGIGLAIFAISSCKGFY